MQTLRLGCVGCPATTSSWVGGWELKKASILLGDLQKSEPLFGGSCFWSLRWLTTPLSVKWIAERNHPRVVQEPVAVLHHVSNADIQRFLTQSNLQEAVEKAGFDYDDVSNSLDVLGMSGLGNCTARALCQAIPSFPGYFRSADLRSFEFDLCKGSRFSDYL